MRKITLKLCLMQFAAFTSYTIAQEVLLTKAQVPNDPFDLESQLNETTSETQKLFTGEELSVLEKINHQDLHQSPRRLAAPGDIAVGKTATWNVGTAGQPGAGSIVGKAISQAQAKAAAGLQVFYAAGQAFLPQSVGKTSAKPDFVVPLNQLQMSLDGAKNLYFLLDVKPQGTYAANITKSYKTISFLAYLATTNTMVINIQAKPYLVAQLTTREAFATNATLVWDGGIAYRYLDYAVDASYAGSTADLNNPRICYGSTPCYTDISPTTVDDPTQVNATAIQLGPIWWGGNLDTSIKQIINLSGQTVFSTALDLATAWNSNDTVIWMGLTPYGVNYALPSNNTYSTIQANLSAIGICFGFETCVGSLVRVRVEDPTAQNDSVKCIGNTCFLFTLQPRVEQILQLDDQTMLIAPYDQVTAWNESGLVIWNGMTPYYAEASIPGNTFVTIQPDAAGIRICSGVGIVNCYLNPTHTPAASAGDTSYCLTDDKNNCYDGPVDTATFEIFQIGKATAIGQLLPLEQTWFSNNTVIWNNQTDGWVITAVLPGDNTFSTVQINLLDPLFQVSPGDYTTYFQNLVEVDGAIEGDEGIAFCLGDFCFSAEQDFNHYDIILVGELYFEVSNTTVADAWNSTEKIIWSGYTPYIYVAQFDSAIGFSTLQPDSATVEFCFSGVCYLNLAPVDMTDEEAAATSVGCLDESNAVCFTGEVDAKNYQIAAIDGFAIPQVQLPFTDAKASGDIVLWDSNYNSWQPQGVFSDNSYTTMEVDITTIVAQVSGTKYNSIVQVDPEDADATAAALWCWQSTCYSGAEVSLDLMSYCLNFDDASYCFVAAGCPDGDCSGQATLSDADGTVMLLANLPSEQNATADKIATDVTICSADSVCVNQITVSVEASGDGTSVCIESLALCFNGQSAEAPVITVQEEEYVPTEPEQMKNALECGAFCDEQQVVLCIDADCINAALHAFDTAWNDDTQSDYIWAGTNSFSFLSLATEAGDSPVNVTLADVVVARFGVATGARFDDNTINLMTLAEDPMAADSYCFETLCYTFISYVYPIEDIIMFDDAGIAAIVQQVSAHTAWVSPQLVFWSLSAGTYITPERFTSWVPTATTPTYNYNIADLRLCGENNVCYAQATLTTPEDEAGICYDGNCFLGTEDTRDFQIAAFGSYTPLVIQMQYADAYQSEITTYFYKSSEEEEPKGAQMVYDVPDHDWFTIEIDQTAVIMCVGSGVSSCYTELEETTSDGVPPEGKELVEIPELGLWVFALPTPFPYSEPLITSAECPDAYVPVNVTLCIEDLCYIALNESFSTAWNDDGTTAFTWVGMQPYVIYDTTSGDESSVYVAIGDVVQCQPGTAGGRFDSSCVAFIDFNADAFESSEDGSITCVAYICYNSQPYEAPNEYVASYNDFGIKLLVNQLTLADAWYSGETVVWAGLSPYQFVGQVPFITIQNIDLNLFECSVCYGSTSCYINIQAFDPNYPPVDDQATLYLGDQNFVADLDSTSYDIATVDEMCILVQTQAFSDAWVSLNEIIWTGGMGYRGLDTMPDTSFSTLSWTLQDLVVCIPGGKICVNNIRRVNPRETPKKNTYIIKLGTNIYNSDVYNKGETQPLPAESRLDVKCAQEASVEVPEEVPEEAPEEVPEETPEEMPEETPEETPEEMTEETPFLKKKHLSGTVHTKKVAPKNKKNLKVPSVKKTHVVVTPEAPKKVNVKPAEVKKPVTKKSHEAKKPVQAKKLVPLKSGIVNLMATHVDNSTNMTKSDQVKERMRMTFRDYYMYAVSGKTSEPSQAGQCQIQCFSLPTFCCASISSLDVSTGLTSYDNLCMNKEVVNSQISVKLGSVDYSLKCSDDTQTVSGATLIKSTFLVIVSAISLFASL